MKFKTLKEIEERRAQIREEMEKDGADLTALEAEVRELKENEAEIRKNAETAKETRRRIADGLAGTVLDSHEAEPHQRTVDEIRSSQEYVDAYARYMITEDDRECRALLTVNAGDSGTVPVPTIVDQIIRTAWENDQILSRVRRTDIRGNLNVPFERSADPAYEHTEGTTEVTEEDLSLGIVSMIPKNVKKWIRVSDEVIDMGGEPMLRYIYDELTHQIIKKLAALVIGDIKGASTSHSSTAVGVPKVSGAPSLTVIPTAEANLSDEAENVVVIMNRLSSAAFVAARAAANFAIDPYDGLTVLYSSALPAYSAADDNAVYAIVGDLNGAQVNYPNGDGVVIKYDDTTEGEKDLVKIIGRQYAAHAVTAPGRFVNITKPAAAVTT